MKGKPISFTRTVDGEEYELSDGYEDNTSPESEEPDKDRLDFLEIIQSCEAWGKLLVFEDTNLLTSLDSLERLELFCELERKLDVEFSEKEMRQYLTVSDLIDRFIELGL